MKLKLVLVKILLFSCLCGAKGQTDGRHTSLEEAFKDPENVIELQLSSIKDKLPKDIVKLTNLETIRLINLSKSYNLNDAFKKLAKYTSVKKIYLYGNAHTTLPASLSDIKTLEFIELNKNVANDLESIIDELAKIEGFKGLSIRSMGLRDLPDNISKLKLKNINLGHNPQLDLAEAFEKLSKPELEVLDISWSGFTVVPESIKVFKNLKRLVIEMNNGDFNNPESYENIAQLKNLKELSIQGNFFGRLDTSIEQLKFLELLEIDGNCIIGESLKTLEKLLPNTEIQNNIPC